MIPKDSKLKFTKSHEWIRLEDDGRATVGISEFAVGQLGDIVFLELPAAGTHVRAKGSFGTVESVKAAVDLYAPVDGDVTAANDDITTNFDLLSEDPYGKAWLVQLQVSDPAQLEGLLSAEEYEAHLQSPDSHS